MANDLIKQENGPYVFYKLRQALLENIVFGPKFVALRVLVAALTSSLIHFGYLVLYLCVVKFTLFDPFYIFSAISELWTSFHTLVVTSIFVSCISLLFILSSREYILGINYVKTYYDFIKCLITRRFILFIGFLHIAIGFCISSLYLIIHSNQFKSEIVMCGLTNNQYCWNAGSTYLMIYGCLTGLYYFFTETVKCRKALQFPTLRLSKFSLIKAVFKRELFALPFNLQLGTIVFVPLYAWLCKPINCTLDGAHVVCVESEEFGSKCIFMEAADSVGNNPYFNILIASFVTGSMFVLTMRTIDSLIWIFLTEHARFDIQPSLWDTNRYILVDALSCNGFPIIKYLAFYDFAFLTESEPERRRKIFSVSSSGGNPRNWRAIYLCCVEIINEFTSLLEGSKKQEENNNFSIPQELLPSIPVPEPDEPSYVPPVVVRNLTGNVEVRYKRISIKKTVKENFRRAVRVLLVLFWSSRFVKWLFMKHGDIDMKVLIEQQWQPVTWAVQGLASLVHFSPTEDKYGVIQSDIIRLIDVLIKLKTSLDESIRRNSNAVFHGCNTLCEDVRLRIVMKEVVTFSLNRILYACKTHYPSIIMSEERIMKLKEFTDVTYS